VRKIILIMLVFLVAACMTEIKPILKPAPQADIATRIVNEQKWLDEAMEHKEFSRDQIRPIQEKLNKIKVKYSNLQSAGTLTAKDSEAINRMLDECSDMLFRLRQQRQKRP